jgi:hypothetical protein
MMELTLRLRQDRVIAADNIFGMPLNVGSKRRGVVLLVGGFAGLLGSQEAHLKQFVGGYFLVHARKHW